MRGGGDVVDDGMDVYRHRLLCWMAANHGSLPTYRYEVMVP